MTGPPNPTTRREALRTLRVRVSVALLVAAALCALVAGKSSGGGLADSYRETGDEVMRTVAAGFSKTFRPADLGSPSVLRRQVRTLAGLHDGLRWVGVYSRSSGGARLAAASRPDRPLSRRTPADRAIRGGRAVREEVETGGAHLTTLTIPLRDGGRVVGALELGYDLAPSDAALSDRNRRTLIVLAALLTAFIVFTTILLDRSIFRPLTLLRLATQRVGSGDLATRLGWKRRDEIGVLAQDFDEMAAGLEAGQQRLQGLAHEDPLTGLSNHRHFQEKLGEAVRRAAREDGRLALMILDIDNFKRINDARGHPFGDQVLKGAGERLRGAMAGVGRPARLGGDEFAVILPGTSREQAFALCESARAAMAAFSTGDFKLRCSGGIACYPDDARSATDLVQLADGALYWAKSSGRSRSRMYDPEHVMVVSEEQRAEFRTLLEQPHAVRPVFQPLVSLPAGEIVGYEALARFDDGRGLPPSWWFAQAHRFGLGLKLEAEAVRVAMAQPGRPPGTFLSVNLSPSALRSPQVRAVLPDDLSGLVIEITEQEEILHEDNEALQKALAPLRARGARIAVDDAGAGYAGLQQVLRMQADVIKLDRSLVSGVNTDRVKAALVRSLVHFAAETDADLCAEGIETIEELQTLGELGVSLAQGFALGRPAPPWSRIEPAVAEFFRRASAPAPVTPHEVSAPTASLRPRTGARRPV